MDPCGRLDRARWGHARSMSEEDPPQDPPDAPSADRAPSRKSAASPPTRHINIRRVSPPRLTGLLDSPVQNLTVGGLYVVVVMIAATAAYMGAGWSFRDALYMVVVTVYTVGYEEVRPINTPLLNVITIALIVLGCTGVIFLTGALVQLITLSQLNKSMGQKRMKRQIDHLTEHVIVCGFGRIGVMLAESLAATSAGFVILEQDEARVAQAQEMGYLCIRGDATLETSLHAAGVTRASALATVLPNDAINVFITLSARSLNPKLMIIARGEEPTTESKLIQAGADKVVMPTHIGAERIAELLMFEESARLMDGLERTHGFKRALRTFGMDLEVVTAAPHSQVVRMTVAAIERQARGSFFILQINRRDGDVITNPPGGMVVREGDGILLMGRANRAAILSALFTPRQRSGVRG
jgi:voltage-gated potassium channel Kch